MNALEYIEYIRRCNTNDLVYLAYNERRKFYSTGDDLSPACVELFHRAFLDNQAAWSAIVEIFGPLITKWIEARTKIDPEDIMQEVFLRLYCNRNNIHNRGETKRLGPILAYLQNVVRSTILNLVRKPSFAKQNISLERITNIIDGEDSIRRAELRVILEERFTKLFSDEIEQLICVLRYEYGLSPREIYWDYREKFRDYDEVAVIIQRITRRLQKDDTLRDLLME